MTDIEVDRPEPWLIIKRPQRSADCKGQQRSPNGLLGQQQLEQWIGVLWREHEMEPAALNDRLGPLAEMLHVGLANPVDPCWEPAAPDSPNQA